MAKTVTDRRRRYALAAGLVLLVAGLACAELSGWPFLAEPLEQAASRALSRKVQLRLDEADGAAASQPWRLQLWGGFRLTTPRLAIAAPAWSQAPHLVSARELQLELGYGDLWRAWNGGALRVRRLKAASLDAWLERRADGRASWDFDTPPAHPETAALRVPVFDALELTAGHVKVRDQPQMIEADAEVSLTPGAMPTQRLQVQASGSYRSLPLTLSIEADGRLAFVASSQDAPPATLALKLSVGRALLDFQGVAQGGWMPQALSGRFRLSGPSLAAVGYPVGLILPTTAAFSSEGRVFRKGSNWRLLMEDATVGSSRLNGEFTYETGLTVPLLSGRLGGSRLMLTDLAPVIGARPAGTDPAHTARPAGARKVLPTRAFDFASLRLMDADLTIVIDEVDLNHPLLRPLQPLKTRLQLARAKLRLTDLEAQIGPGRLQGQLQLEGDGDEALAQAQLDWNGVRLDQWITQPRAKGAPPFIAGKLQGRADVTGRGRSMADILGSLSGQLRTEVHEGSVSQLAIEAAGLDLAQGLGVLLRGDKAVPISCAVASLVAERGVLRPQLVALDTPDSTVWVAGSLSLADETMDLRAVVAPRDFSPLTLRAPLHVHGPFTAPTVSLDRKVVEAKVVTAAALALVNPLAALIPLLDRGNAEQADRTAHACRSLAQRAQSHAARSRPAPSAATTPLAR